MLVETTAGRGPVGGICISERSVNIPWDMRLGEAGEEYQFVERLSEGLSYPSGRLLDGLPADIPFGAWVF
jgi:hypothetical protein